MSAIFSPAVNLEREVATLGRGTRLMLCMAVAAVHALVAWMVWKSAAVVAPSSESGMLTIQWLESGSQAQAQTRPAARQSRQLEQSPKATRPEAQPQPLQTHAEPSLPAQAVTRPNVPQPDSVALESPPQQVIAPASIEGQVPMLTQPLAQSGQAQPKLVSESEVRYERRPKPFYPEASRRRGESGQVLVRAVIDTGGRPVEVAIQRSSGYTRLDDAALAAALASRVKPPLENGMTVSIRVVMNIEFELED